MCFEKAGHKFVINYELTPEGVVEAGRALLKMARHSELRLTLGDVSQAMLSFETELAAKQAIGR
jgi:hypothetical protein